jgi:uncharacterized protein (UPF0264 family)
MASNSLSFSGQRPGLLVSVRSADEALTALAGGAHVIDVKEPDRGPLGPADRHTISAIARSVQGRATVTAAMGELMDLIATQNGNQQSVVVGGVSLFKIGLAGCGLIGDWRARWLQTINTIVSPPANTSARPVGVVYADWTAAQAPPPHDVLSTAIECGCPALLIDTWNKSTGSLFDHFPIDALRQFLDAVHSQHLAVVLAGSLAGDSFAAAARLMPDLVAVRSAACDSGRGGTVSIHRVRELKRIIAETARTAGAR